MASLGDRYSKAVVTGAGSGLGKAFAQMLIAEGVEVWGTSRDCERLSGWQGLHPVELDLAYAQSVARFCEWLTTDLPDVDVLINNAGSGSFYAIEDFPPEEIQAQIDVLLAAPIRLTQAAFRLMQARGHGAIVNVASLAAEFPLPYMPLYNAAKAGLSNFTRSLDFDGGCGVKLIDFQPGDYRTNFNAAAQTSPTKESPRRKDLHTAWKALESHLQNAPSPERAAADLHRALRHGRSGVVTSGGFFQAKVAPCLARLACWPMKRDCMRRYYGLSKQ